MKTSFIAIAISLALSVSALPQFGQNNRQGLQRGNNVGSNGGFGNQSQNGAKGGNKAGATTANKGGSAIANQGGNKANNAGTKSTAAGAASTSTSAAVSSTAAAAGSAKAGSASSSANSTTAGTSTEDPQASTTLDPAVIATGFANNGQDVPTAGQVASLTSTNNFINFCLTVPNLPITNGKQITTGSCNPAPMGSIPSTDNMPSAKFTFPPNGGSVAANTAFTISMAVANFQTGNFVNAEENYFAAPQQLNSGGQIIGHSHVVVESLSALDQTTPTNPKVFAFFKGLNAAAVNGLLTADVTAGLPAGFYKVSSINTAANHQPVLVPIAQHGSLDDVAYFTVTDSGAAAASNATAASGASTAASTTAAAASASSTSLAKNAPGAQVPPPPKKVAVQAPGPKAVPPPPKQIANPPKLNSNQNNNNGRGRRSMLRRRL